MKKFLVTGAAGFIGSNVLRNLLNLNYDAYGLDNYGFSSTSNSNDLKERIIQFDLNDKDNIAKHITDYENIIHLAGVDDRNYFRKNFYSSNDINIQCTINIIEQLNENQKIIYISSNMVYGESIYLPIDENHPLLADDPYALSKLIAESYVRSFSLEKKFKYKIIRNFNTIGPGQNIQSLIPSLIIEGINNKKIEVWSPNAIRDFQSVQACAKNIINISVNDKIENEVVNLGTGYQINMQSLIKKICEILKCEMIVTNKTKPISFKNYANIDKLKSKIGNSFCTTNLNETLEETINYYKKIIR